MKGSLNNNGSSRATLLNSIKLENMKFRYRNCKFVRMLSSYEIILLEQIIKLEPTSAVQPYDSRGHFTIVSGQPLEICCFIWK